MAIYHLSAKVVSRANGQSVVASAAYRASEALYDNRYGLTHDYTRKHGVEHCEILAPEDAPAWVYDRQALWNAVEAGEKRKDSQLAREIEIGLSVELTHDENVELVREYVKNEFVSKGMIADFSIHEDDAHNPHAHVLLTMRSITEQGFGEKDRSWNAKGELLGWRAAWASRANEHLARAGHAVRIDHRTLEAQGIELEPGQKIGVGRDRQGDEKLPRHVAERIAAQERIARENGEAILADPRVALNAITHQRATFTERDLAKFLHTRTLGAEQFQAAMLKVTTSSDLVALGRDDFKRIRYTSRGMLEAEKSLLQRSLVMDPRRGHGVAASRQAAVLAESGLSEEQRAAFEHVTGEGDLKALVGVAGSGKSTMLEAARRGWEAEGLTVKGAALSGIAAENLEVASGIKSRTLASYEWAWNEKRDPLTRDDVLVIDEAGMVGTKQLERILASADKARAKVVLVGDPEQLQAIEAGAAFRAIVGQVGMAEMSEVRRQKDPWMRAATQSLATGRTTEALSAYEGQGAIVATDTCEAAREALLERWNLDRAGAAPTASQLIVAYTREDVRDLNARARETRRDRHELGRSQSIQTSRGEREIAVGERIMFLRNEKSLGVKNGSLGTVERIEDGALQVRLDGKDETRVIVETRDYQDLDYGYASTIHKSQGATVDRTYILASRYFDRHTSYVALSRHREEATLFWGREEFAGRAGQGASIDAAEAKRNFVGVLSRARPKELAHDYLEGGRSSPPLTENVRERMARSAIDRSAPAADIPGAEEKLSVEEMQRRARENWLALRAPQPDQALSIEEQQRQARERWREYQQSKGAEDARDQPVERDKGEAQERGKPADHGIDDDLSL